MGSYMYSIICSIMYNLYRSSFKFHELINLPETLIKFKPLLKCYNVNGKLDLNN